MADVSEKHGRDLILLIAGFISLVLIVCSVVMMNEYSDELADQAGVKARLYSSEVTSVLHSNVDALITTSKMVVSRRPSFENENDFQAWVRQELPDGLEEEDPRLADSFARYFKDGVEYDDTGSVFEPSQEVPRVRELALGETAACAGYIAERTKNFNMVAVVVPMRSREYADTVVLFFRPGVLTDESGAPEKQYVESSSLTAFCTGEGEILQLYANREGDVATHGNVYEYLRGKINDKSLIDTLQSDAYAGKEGTFLTSFGGEDYVIALGSVGASNGGFTVISLYKCTDIYSSGYNTVNTILTTLIIFFTVMILLAAYFIISNRQTAKKILTMNDTDKRLNCPSRVKFEREAEEIIDHNKGSDYAVVVMDVKHFNYLSDTMDYDAVTQLLTYVKLLCNKALRLNETYGYMKDGRFVMLLHYRSIDALSNRLQTICTLARDYVGNLPASYRLELFGGIYENSMHATEKIAKMIELANEAKEAINKTMDFGSFRLYNEHLQQSHLEEEYIEVHMASALENKNFVVVYQPKYNIAHDSPDGAEALVRWYRPDTNEYMRPAVFMPLFEANGFIVKLDKYVYEQVCIYMHEAVEQSQRVYPISVNVSRVTAIQKDFVDYYVERKKKYNIADGYIMIEFTESFAYENYDYLRQIISKLHANGFRCSIDDFGSGYSSYNILKELPMDEIKLDRFFIERGLSEERDMKILSSVITVAHELNMKVTQEGVETADQLTMLEKLGCQVIQGYHYSKPLFLSDFVDFINNRKKGSLHHNPQRP